MIQTTDNTESPQDGTKVLLTNQEAGMGPAAHARADRRRWLKRIEESAPRFTETPRGERLARLNNALAHIDDLGQLELEAPVLGPGTGAESPPRRSKRLGRVCFAAAFGVLVSVSVGLLYGQSTQATESAVSTPALDPSAACRELAGLVPAAMSRQTRADAITVELIVANANGDVDAIRRANGSSLTATPEETTEIQRLNRMKHDCESHPPCQAAMKNLATASTINTSQLSRLRVASASVIYGRFTIPAERDHKVSTELAAARSEGSAAMQMLTKATEQLASCT